MIKGWIKNSFIDYPGKIATTVFVGGCNFRCPYCHNGDLITKFDKLQDITEEEIFSFLKKRSKILDGVVITGGEATLYKNIIDFMKTIKEIGLSVKLDTNGYNPEIVEKVLEQNCVDYIAMDIKNSLEKYSETVGFELMDLTKIVKSINLIQNGNVDYEFRTTVMKEFHNEKDLLAIGTLLEGSKKYVLQKYQKSDKQLSNKEFTPYNNEEMLSFKKSLEIYFEKIYVRGI